MARIPILAIVALLLAGPVVAQAPIVLDGVGDDWDPAWQVASDGLDVFLTDTGLHPHEAPTYARSGYDAIGLWAHYQPADDHWYFRIDVDGRAGDSDSQVGTAGDPGVGTHGFDEGPLVAPPFEDGDGLGNSEAYKLGFQFQSGGSGATAELGPGSAILPGVVASTTAGLDGLGVYSTTVPGVVEFALDRETLFPESSAYHQLWLSAQVGDNNDRVSDDQVTATLVIALDLAAYCPEAPIVAGDNATFPMDYAIPAAATFGVHDVVLAVVIPPGTTFVGASDGGVEAGGLITWDLGDLAPGDADQVTFTLRVDDPLTSLSFPSEMTCAEGLRFKTANECPVLQPTATPSPTPTSTATPSPDELPLVPEPATVTLMLAGLAGLGGYAALQWRARRRS
ncbi:MAG: PEP-CTERM sorting domain-containing protein [Anaerolineae bacterium]